MQEDDASEIAKLETQIKYTQEMVDRFTARRNALLQALATYNPNHPLLRKQEGASGKYVGLRQWIAANRALADHGDKMLYDELVKYLIANGAGAGKERQEASIHLSLTKAVEAGMFASDGHSIWRTKLAPPPGKEDPRSRAKMKERG